MSKKAIDLNNLEKFLVKTQNKLNEGIEDIGNKNMKLLDNFLTEVRSEKNNMINSNLKFDFMDLNENKDNFISKEFCCENNLFYSKPIKDKNQDNDIINIHQSNDAQKSDKSKQGKLIFICSFDYSQRITKLKNLR